MDPLPPDMLYYIVMLCCRTPCKECEARIRWVSRWPHAMYSPYGRQHVYATVHRLPIAEVTAAAPDTQTAIILSVHSRR